MFHSLIYCPIVVINVLFDTVITQYHTEPKTSAQTDWIRFDMISCFEPFPYCHIKQPKI